MTRRLLPLALLAAAAVVMTGCIGLSVLADEDGAQRDLIGDVHLTATTCPTDIELLFTTDPSSLPDPCLNEDDLLERVDDGDTVSLPQQLLVAFRVPAGAQAPRTLTAHGRVIPFSGLPFGGLPIGGLPSATRTAARTAARELATRGRKARASRLVGPGTPDILEGDVHFRQAPEMQDQLEAFYHGESGTGPFAIPEAADILHPGQKIVGYVSEPLPGMLADDLDIEGDFGLPASGAAPFAGPFNHQAFVGTRMAFPDEILGDGPSPFPGGGPNPFSPDRPVDCSFDGPDGALCPLPDLHLRDADLQDALTGTDLATRDLRIGQGPYAGGRQGGTATVPFKLLGAGPAGGGNLALSATTTIPGATATPRDATLRFPGTGAFGQPVTVRIPEDAAPGEYQVELVAKVGDQIRRAVGLITVLAKEAGDVPPPIDDRTTPDRLYVENSGRLAFGYICNHSEAECQHSEGVYYQNPSTIPGLKAAAAAKGKFRMHRLGRKRFIGHQNARSRVKLKLYRSARRATLRKGRTLRGLLVIRSGGKSTVPTVRRVTIRARRRK